MFTLTFCWALELQCWSWVANIVIIFVLTAELGSSEMVKETGCTVTFYMNTAESVATNGTKVTLHGRDLWAEFHKCTTEMIITKAGR
jgi:hypothetical protein